MKIFLAFFQSNAQHPIPAYGFWEYYIKNGIEEAGHSWMESGVDWAEGLVPKSKIAQDNWKSSTWEKTLDCIKKNRPDIFLGYLYPEQVDKNAVRQVQKLGIPCINFFCDNVRLFQKAPSAFSVFDLNWVPEFKAIKLYKNAKYPYLNLPMPMWVKPKYRTMSIPESNQISFIGSKDKLRARLFEQVIKLEPKLPLSIYGHAWQSDQIAEVTKKNNNLYNSLMSQFASVKIDGLMGYIRKLQQRNAPPIDFDVLLPYVKGKPTFDEYVKLSKGGVVTLGINRYPSFRYPLDKPDTYSRLRDVEAPMLGCCYLTEWTAGLDELYEIGKEIEVFRNAEELIVKCNQLITDKNKREEMRKRSQITALNNHSISNSINRITNFFFNSSKE